MHLPTAKQTGFTLVELMVVISIIAILAAVGLTVYGKAQILARDGKRKQDLQEIAKALELFKQTTGHYPCTGPTNGGWQLSNPATAYWITDDSGGGGTGCGTVTFDYTYIKNMPVDPINTGTGVLADNVYTYWAYDTSGTSGCPGPAGKFFALRTGLENKSDPDRTGLKHYTWCDGKEIWAAGSGGSGGTGGAYQWPNNDYIITSN